jgi:hypothetical protein
MSEITRFTVEHKWRRQMRWSCQVVGIAAYENPG